MKKKIIFVFCILIGILFFNIPVKASKKPIIVYEFYGTTCGYCANLNNWFNSIEGEYGEYFDLVKFDVWAKSENQDLMHKVADHLNDRVGGVPYLVIGKNSVNGFGGSEAEKQKIINYILEEYNKNESERYMGVYEIVYNGTTTDVTIIDELGGISGALSTIMDFITE